MTSGGEDLVPGPESGANMSLRGLEVAPEVPDYLSFSLLLLLQTLTVETERYIAALGKKHSLKHRELQAVNALINSERLGSPMTAGAMMSQLSLGSAATSELIGRLCDSGHLRRSTGTTDRRQVILSSTNTAQETGASVFGPLAVQLLELTARYNNEELQVLETFIRELIQATTTARLEAADGEHPGT